MVPRCFAMVAFGNLAYTSLRTNEQMSERSSNATYLIRVVLITC